MARLLTQSETAEKLRSLGARAAGLFLRSRNPIAGFLRYQWAPVKAYLKANCRPARNDCPDGSNGVLPADCTHFISHALDCTSVLVNDASVTCGKGLATNARELMEAFDRSTGMYANVKYISDHQEAKEGDFCFVPNWFGLDAQHAMVVAGSFVKTATGEIRGPVWGHTNSRCAEVVTVDADLVVYRIADRINP